MFFNLFPLLRLVIAPFIVWPPADGPCRSDLNGDGIISMTDLLLLLSDFGLYCDTVPPEPLVWPDIRFSELHYNPSIDQGSDSDFEFLELTNLDTVDVNLTGWSISEGLEFTFPEESWLPAGSYVVVTTAPMSYSGLGYPVFDWGGGGLNNSGEMLALRAPNGAVVEYVQYSDHSPWDSAPDGQGPSLERLFLDGPAQEAGSWAASIGVGGTPGTVNSLWID